MSTTSYLNISKKRNFLSHRQRRILTWSGVVHSNKTYTQAYCRLFCHNELLSINFSLIRCISGDIEKIKNKNAVIRFLWTYYFFGVGVRSAKFHKIFIRVSPKIVKSVCRIRSPRNKLFRKTRSLEKHFYAKIFVKRPSSYHKNA